MEAEKERKISRIKVGTFLIVMFLLVYIPSLIHWMYGRDINTDIIKIGTLEESVNAEAFLIRNEEVLKSSFQGTCIPEVDEGDKIPANFNAATVLRADSEDLLDALKQKDVEIIKAQQEKNKNKKIFSSDIIKIENEIDDKIKVMVGVSSINNMIQSEEIGNQINSLIEKKATINGDTGSTDNYITSLKKEKEVLQNKIKANTSVIKAKTPGIISYVVDGYEDVLNPESIKGLTPEFLSGIKTQYSVNNVSRKNIEAGEPFAKIVKDIDFYIVVVLDSSKARFFKQGNTVGVRMNEINKATEGKIEYISGNKGGKYVIAVKVNEGVSETAALRKTNVDLIAKHYEGYKVPLSSLRDVNLSTMKASIVLVKASCARVKDVKITGRNDAFAIIGNIDDKKEDSMGLYDVYVCKPGNIQEGQMIGE